MGSANLRISGASLRINFGISGANLEIQEKLCPCLKIQLELAGMFATAGKMWGRSAAKKLMMGPIAKRRAEQNAEFQ